MTKPLQLAQVRATLIANNGNLAATARALKVSRTCIYDWESRCPELKNLRTESSETLVDLAEDKIRKAVERGAPWAVKLVLTRQGRSRGWGMSVDVGLNGNATGIIHILKLPDNGRNPDIDMPSSSLSDDSKSRE